MAKFCRHCGNPVAEGQVCSCPGAQREWQATAPQQPPVAPQQPVYQQPAQPQYLQPQYQQPQYPQQPQYQQPQYQQPVQPKAPSTLVPELKDVLLTGLKTPRQAGIKLLAGSSKLPVTGILAGIHALSIFLLIWSLVGSLVGTFEDMMGSYGSLMESKLDITLPFFPMLLGGILLGAIAIGISGLVIFVFSKITKREINIVDCIGLAAADSIYPSILVLVTILFGFISIYLQLIAVVLLLVVSVINTLDTARVYAGLEVGASTKNYMLAAVCILAAILVVIFAAKLICVDWCIGSVEIAGQKLGDAFDLLGSLGDLGSLIG